MQPPPRCPFLKRHLAGLKILILHQSFELWGYVCSTIPGLRVLRTVEDAILGTAPRTPQIPCTPELPTAVHTYPGWEALPPSLSRFAALASQSGSSVKATLCFLFLFLFFKAYLQIYSIDLHTYGFFLGSPVPVFPWGSACISFRGLWPGLSQATSLFCLQS